MIRVGLVNSEFKLKEGEHLNRSPNRPIIAVGHGYIWIGNNADNDMACFATLTGKKTLLRLAAAIKSEAMKLRR